MTNYHIVVVFGNKETRYLVPATTAYEAVAKMVVTWRNDFADSYKIVSVEEVKP